MLNSTLTQGFGTISIKECAELLGKPTSTIYSWIRNGDIPKSCYTRIGKCIFILNEPMKKFLNGDHTIVTKRLEEKMYKESSLLNFEHAKEYKDLIDYVHDEVKNKKGIDLKIEQEFVNWEQ